MKKYSNSKAKRLANHNKPQEVDEEAEIESLRKRRIDEAPEPGTQLQSNGELKFDMLPISSKTLKGLTEASLTVCTEIQAAALPHALAGRDILGAAKTGSGKTLSFVIPLIEKLYTERWSNDDGLAAIVITPTRELALQIFEVVRIVGKKHQFSAGLITGGKKEFEGEQERVITMNILVATPGRLLQHFEQTVGFDASQLMVLVLDEADRILDMGFKQQLDAIVEYLPNSRQTMLFSATQTKSVKDLARLSLKNAEYVAVRSEDNEVTPKQLVQNYIVCQLHDKLDILFSFLKTHLKSKIIVFFSTCSQVRFVYECFRGMQPGIPLVALHGKIKQERRTMIYMDYIKKSAACLIATDIAARGLDFPNVDWVIQCDAPEDAAMYIHRAGRTARYNAGGRAMLMLTPQEEQTVSRQLSEAGVPIQKLTVNPKKTFSVAAKAAALLAAQPEYRLYAKKAFTGYLRSIQLLPANNQLDVNTLPLDEFATSLGLPFTPPVPVVERGAAGREEVRDKKNVNRSLDKLKKQIQEAKAAKKAAREAAKLNGDKAPAAVAMVDSDSDDEELLKSKKKKDKKAAKDDKKKQKVLVESDSEDDGEEFLKIKQKPSSTAAAGSDESDAEKQREAELKVKKPKKLKINMDGEQKGIKEAGGAKKIAFDEEGNSVSASRISLAAAASVAAADGQRKTAEEVAARIAQHASEVKARIDRGRKEDAEREKQRIREKRLKAKRDADAGDEDEEDEDGEGGGVTLSNFVPESSGSDSSDSESDRESDSGSSDSEDEVRKPKGKPSAVAKRRKDLTSSSSSSSDDSDDSESEEQGTTKKTVQASKLQQKKKQQTASAKRKRDDTSSDSGSDSDNSDVDAESIKKQEEMVMQMMKRKK